MKVAVIGGGPSGIVTLKYLINAHRSLHTRPIEARLFESEESVGGTFYARTYEDAELVSSKQLTLFSDFRLPNEPDFLSAKRYIEYVRDYCTHFKLWEHINLSTKVQSVTRDTTGKHTVTYMSQKTGESGQWECDAIAVCSGLHVTPNIPQIPGMENIPLQMHSSEFKSREQLGKDKTVLVLGSGETGADISYMAVTAPTKRVIMCHRSGFHFAPKRNLKPVFFPFLRRKDSKPAPPPNKTDTIPLDNARASLFDTAYVHPLLRNHTILWAFYDTYVRSILWLNTGTPEGLDQLVGEPDPEKNHVSRIFFNKSGNAGPYISNPYRRSAKYANNRVDKIRRALVQVPIVNTNGKYIDLAPWPESVSPTGVVTFSQTNRLEYERIRNDSVKPDIVIYCTGYRQEFAFFEQHNKFCQQNEKLGHSNHVNGDNGDIKTPSPRCYPLANEADVRDVWKHTDHTVGFIGFVRPSLGAIPPIAEMQAQVWIVNLVAPDYFPRPLLPSTSTLGRGSGDDQESHYRLAHPSGSRIKYGVDHESYIYQLALDMGSAIGIIDILWRGLVERCLLGMGSGPNGQTRSGWKLPLVWALGANYNAKFRLTGPWQWEGGAEEVMEGELWDVIRRRRWFWDLFLLSFLPMMIFGPLSLGVWIYATVYWLVTGVEPTGPLDLTFGLGGKEKPTCSAEENAWREKMLAKKFDFEDGCY
ncbi:dimethylaniline monooxygenase [Naviculisporaceae sp. PSN 640]